MSAKGVPHGHTESGGYSTRRHMLELVRPEAVLPDRALYLPTFSHFLIVNKTSLSLSFSTSSSPHGASCCCAAAGFWSTGTPAGSGKPCMYSSALGNTCSKTQIHPGYIVHTVVAFLSHQDLQDARASSLSLPRTCMAFKVH